MNVAKVVALNPKVEESTVRTLAMDKLEALESTGKVLDAVYKTEEVKRQYKEVNAMYEELRTLFSGNPEVLNLLLKLEDRETELLSVVSDEYFALGYSSGMQFLRNLHKELDADVR